MEPPPPSLSSTPVASTVVPASTTHLPPPLPITHVTSSYPESLESSPRSRTTDALDDLPPSAAASSKLRLMCSYGGHILPRPHDKSLCYMGGDTRIVVVDRNSSLSSLITRLSTTLLNNRSFTLKYQLPSEDLDSLISVTTDEDLENMIEEYDRTIITTAADSAKSSRLRLFLFTEKPEATQSMGKILESSAKSDDWFLDALNNAGLTISRGFSDSLLLGNNLESSVKDDDVVSVITVKHQQIEQAPSQQQQQGGGGGQDVQNVADSPVLDSSSYESASSSPTLANLPPIRVRAEEAGGVKVMMHDQKLGIEEQFARFNVGSKQRLQLPEDGFAAISSPPPIPVSISLPAAPVNATTVSSEFNDERSDHVAVYRKPPTPHSQPQNLPPPQGHHVKSNSCGHELPSPNSVSSDNSMNNNPVFHQKPMSQMTPSEINPSDQHNQNQEPGYIIHPQQQSAQSQQQFTHAAPPQYIHHHPLPTYIPIYPSLQQSFHRHPGQLDQQPYPVYYIASPVPPSPYSMHVPQSGSVSDAPGSLPSNHPQAPLNNTVMAPPSTNHLGSVAPGPGGKSESGVYVAASGMGGAQMVHQIPTSQQQFMGYSQIHHPPQSCSAGVPNYVDNAQKQVFYTLPIGHAQYQTMTWPPPAVVLPEDSTAAKLPAENMSQQIQSSQPL